MIDLKKAADWLDGTWTGADPAQLKRLAALLRSAAGADVAQIMKLIDEFAQTSAHCLLNIRPKTDLAVQRAVLESALRLLVAQIPRWRPIAEIPSDGTFLVYMPEERPGDQMHAARWHPNVKVIGGVFAFDRKPPTHYQPLPPAPKEPNHG